jgi:hypothetical protein
MHAGGAVAAKWANSKRVVVAASPSVRHHHNPITTMTATKR